MLVQAIDRQIKTVTFAAALAVASCSVPAAIISQVATANSSGSGTNSTTLPAFSIGAGNTLAVLVATESGTSPTHSVTFGGNAVTDVVTVNETNQRASIYYIINPSVTSGDVVVTFDSNAIFAVTAVSLSNVASLGDSDSFGEPESGSSIPRPWTLGYNGTAGGFVLGAFVDNDFNNGTPTLSIVGSHINNDVVNDYYQRLDGTSTVSAGRALAGAPIAADGSFSEVFTEGGTSASTRNAGALAAFVAVPEPTSLALIGLVAVPAMRRRRIGH